MTRCSNKLGIGLAKCDYLVENKVSRLIMACRSTDKAEKARQEVVKKIKNDSTTVEVWKIDLASLSSCREFASKWNANPDNKIDILYLNAGLIAPNASLITSEDGLEMTYAVSLYYGIISLTDEVDSVMCWVIWLLSSNFSHHLLYQTIHASFSLDRVVQKCLLSLITQVLTREHH